MFLVLVVMVTVVVIVEGEPTPSPLQNGLGGGTRLANAHENAHANRCS